MKHFLALLLGAAAALTLSGTMPADARSPLQQFRGLERGAGSGGISLPNTPTLTTTTAGSAFLPSCSTGGSGPEYPKTFTFDPAKIVGVQPRSATAAMGLTPHVEQWRGGVKIADWSKLNGEFDPVTGTPTVCAFTDRAANPGAYDQAHGEPCGGPFTSASNSAAWQKGDTFKLHAAAYYEAPFMAPGIKYSTSINYTGGGTSFTVPDITKLLVGDAFGRDTVHITPGTKIATITPGAGTTGTITVDQPLLGTGPQTASISVWRDFDDITIVGITENVGGIPTRPAIRYNDSVSLAMTGNKGIVSFYSRSSFEEASIRNMLWDNLDVIVDKPPYGQLSWLYPTDQGLIYFGGTEVQGPIRFQNSRVMGGIYMASPNGASGLITGGIGNFRRMTGVWTFDRMIFAFNGGAKGPQHDIYMGTGDSSLVVTNSWSHDTKYGHHYKSRFKMNTFIGNLLEGGEPVHEADGNWAESNLIHLPCGGGLIAANNTFIKKHNGDANNGVMIRHMDAAQECFVEYNPAFGVRAYSVSEVIDLPMHADFNTWATLAKLGSGTNIGSNSIYPIDFKGKDVTVGGTRNYILPGDPNFVTTDVSFKGNVFVGFCPFSVGNLGNFPWYENAPLQPVGPNVYAGFADLTQSWGLQSSAAMSITGDTSNVGVPAYVHAAQPGALRAAATVGAQDAYAGTALPQTVPDLYFTADDYYLLSGDTTTLRWKTTGPVTGCTASGGWSGSKGSSGTQVITPPSSVPTDYTLTCTDGVHATDPYTFTINAIDPPVINSFTASTTTTSGPSQPVIFTWTTQNSDFCNFGGPILDQDKANWHATYNPPQSQTYWLQCHGVGSWHWTSYASIPITVTGTTAKPTVVFRVLPSTLSVAAGDTIAHFHWNSADADSCTGTNFSTGGATSGDLDVTPGLAANTSRTYSISCANSGTGQTSLTRSIQVFGAP